MKNLIDNLYFTKKEWIAAKWDKWETKAIDLIFVAWLVIMVSLLVKAIIN